MDFLLIGGIEGRNKGEALLMDMANALSSGQLPDKALSDQFVAAVRSMAKEPDRSLRADMFINGIGLRNPAHAPKKDYKGQTIEKEIALDYWLERLQGAKKTKAKSLTAELWQRSPSTPDGYPSTKTVENFVKAHPKQGMLAWKFIEVIKPSPSPEWLAEIKAEIMEKLENNI